MSGQKEMSAIIDARWLGPCKADQKPGDVILGNGARINILDGPGPNRPPRRPPGN